MINVVSDTRKQCCNVVKAYENADVDIVCHLHSTV